MNANPADCFAPAAPLMTMRAALDLIETRTDCIAGTETVPLADTSGRILAADVTSPRAVPPHDSVAVDGYAFAAADAARGALPMRGRAAPGEARQDLVHGTAMRVFTGAIMPAGADTVAPEETARLVGDTVNLPALPRGANCRHRGEDIAAGALALTAGTRLRPQHLALAAALGLSTLDVRRRLRVALLSSGNELREPGHDLPPGAIFDANRPMLMALLRGLGCAATDLGIVPDAPEATRAALADAARTHDAIVCSGGVSAGETDHVRAGVETLGALHLWRLAIRPGKPLALGRIDACTFVGLPGNPAAALVCFLRFARPLLLRLAGAADTAPRLRQAVADFEHRKREGLHEFLRGTLTSDGRARAFPRQGSALITSLTGSDGLIEIDEGLTEVRPGDAVAFLPYAEVMG